MRSRRVMRLSVPRSRRSSTPIARRSEALDVAAIADLFSYPCHITADGDDVTVTAVPSLEAWVPNETPRLQALMRHHRFT